MSEARSIARRSLGGMAAVVAVAGIKFVTAFASQVVLIRLLAPEVWGAFAYLLVVHGAFGMFRSLRGAEYYVRLPDERGRAEYPTIFTVEVSLGTLLAILGFVAARPLLAAAGAPDLAPHFQVLAAHFVLFGLGLPGAVLQRRLEFWRLQISSVAGAFLRPAAKILFAWLDWGLFALVAGDVVGFALELAVLWIVARVRPRLAFDRRVARSLAAFGWPLVLSQLLSFYYWKIDDVFVYHLVSEEALGWYYLAFRIPEFVFGLKLTVSPVVFAALSRLRDGPERRAAFEALTRYTFVATAPIVLVTSLYGGEWIRLLFGPGWEASVLPFQVLMATACLRMVFGYSADLVVVSGRTTILVWITLANAVALTVLGWFLTRAWGIAGTALAVAGTIVLSLPVAILLARRLAGARHASALARPAAVLAGVAAAAWLARSTIPYGFALPSAVWTVVYLGLVVWLEPSVRRDWRFLRGPSGPAT